jgi:hypothetical protein
VNSVISNNSLMYFYFIFRAARLNAFSMLLHCYKRMKLRVSSLNSVHLDTLKFHKCANFLSVCPSVRTRERIFVKFDIWVFTDFDTFYFD